MRLILRANRGQMNAQRNKNDSQGYFVKRERVEDKGCGADYTIERM